MREWSLAGSGDARLTRRLITTGELNAPPTDEDTTVLLDRSGRVVDTRSWTPDGPGGRGQLELLELPDKPQSATSIVGMLQAAYAQHRLRSAGTTADGLLRLRSKVGGAPCERIEVLLDPRTFIPERIVTSFHLTRPSAPCAPGDPRLRTVDTVTSARTLPATGANRQLLEVGDWPTARVGRLQVIETRVPGTNRTHISNEFSRMTHLPDRPPLAEDRGGRLEGLWRRLP